MHTPGPWTVRHDFRCGNGKLCIGVSAARIGPKSGAVAWPSGTDETQELANAHLIAAAPDMLAALQLIHANSGESPEWIRSRIDAVIARATGGK